MGRFLFTDEVMLHMAAAAAIKKCFKEVFDVFNIVS